MSLLFTHTRNKGFTLIELIVVVSLISLMLFFAVPRFQGAVFQDHTKQVSRWIILKVRALKEKSVREQRRCVLHINLDENTIWTTHAAMSAEERQAAAAKGYHIPDDVDVLDVEYPNEKKTSTGQADIFFYEKGFSDKAIIHIENSHNGQRSFLIEPFLYRVRMYPEYVEFKD